MRCLVYVKFLPGGSLAPEEFFSRINAQWSCIENTELRNELDSIGKSPKRRLRRSAVCIADYESVEQFAADLAIMPGAGISSVEVVPIPQETDLQYIVEVVRSGAIIANAN